MERRNAWLSYKEAEEAEMEKDTDRFHVLA